MNKVVFALAFLAMATLTQMALADDNANPYHPDISSKPVPFKVGMSFDVSVPSGAAVGLEARLPHLPWFKLGFSGTYTLSPGIRGNLLIDPVNFPIAPLLNVDMGHQFTFTVPSVNNSPSGEFTYYDFQAGLGFGSRDSFRFMLMGGMSYLNGSVSHFQGVLPANSSVTIGNPDFKGWLPNAKIGFNWLF